MSPSRFVPLGLALSALFALPARSGPETDMQLQLKKLAGAIAADLDKLGQKAIALGKFEAVPLLASSAGASVKKGLAAQFAKLGLEVREDANHMVHGMIKAPKVDKLTSNTGASCVIAATLTNQRDDEEIGKYNTEAKLTSLSDIAALAGATAALPPPDKGKDRGQALVESIASPKARLAPSKPGAKGLTRISAGAGRPYAIELIVKQSDGSYLPRAVDLKRGRPEVPIKRAEVYGLRIVNDSEHDAAVRVSVDGLSTFEFCDPKANFTHLIVAKKSVALIKGWYVNQNESREFKVTEYAQGAAAKLGRPEADAGMVTVQFHAAWPSDGLPPPDERATRGDATGMGDPVNQRFELVKRTIGVERDVVTVRYNVPDALEGPP